jgi:hypothetical protein
MGKKKTMLEINKEADDELLKDHPLRFEALKGGLILSSSFITNQVPVEAGVLACKHLIAVYEKALKEGLINKDGSSTEKPDLSYIR